MRRTIFKAAVAGVALATALTACGGDSGSSADGGGGAPQSGDPDNELYQAALEEGELVWYSSTPTDAVESFQEAYPDITVNFVRLASGELGTRYAQERGAGAAPADVVTIADDRFIADARDNDWVITDPDLPALEDWPEEFYDEGVAVAGIATYGVGYNTQLIEEPPTTWEEALDPAYEGQMQNGDPRNVPGYLALMHLLREEYGSEFLQSIQDLGVTYEGSQVSVNQAIGSGAVSVSLTDSNVLVQDIASQGAPIAFQEMSPTTGSEFYTFLSADAPNPNAAKLLMNYLLSQEGQEVFNAEQSSPLSEDIGLPLPEDYRHYTYEELEEARDSVLADLGLE